MGSTAIVVFSCVAGGVLLISLLISGALWARLAAVDDRCVALGAEMLKTSQPKQLERAVAVAESSDARVTNAVLELGKFKEQIHAEVQRYYAIMRRAEKADKFEKPTTTSTEAELAPPDEVSVDSLNMKKPGEAPENETRAELRARARAAGL